MKKEFWQYDPLKKKPLLTLISIFLIIAVSFFLRCYKIDKSPPGFYADETSIAYNAYSILKTGRDEYNISFPIFFRAFGDNKNPIFIYSLVPLIAISDLNVKTIRMGSALWGSLGILSLFWLAKTITKNNLYAIISAIVLALMPWQLHYSRLAFEAITFPVLLTIFLALFQNWLKKNNLFYASLSGLVLGLTFYTYTTARFWVPVFVILLILLFSKELIKKRQGAILFFTFTFLTILPAYFWEKTYPGSLTSRFRGIAVWNGCENIKEVFYEFLRTFFGHWHPKFLFYSGDINIRHSSRVSSEILLSLSPFFILGIILSFKYLIKQKIWKFIFILITLFPLAASLTKTDPIATRTLHITPFFALTIALPIWWVVKTLSKDKKSLIFGLSIIISAIFLEFSFYYYHLIHIYPSMSWRSWHGFDGSLPPAITWAYEKSKKEKLPLFLSGRIEQAYIQGLFFTKADPKIWQKYHVAPFQIIGQSQKVPLKGIAVLTKEECERKINLKVLKNFGRTIGETDYCVVSL